MVNRLKVAMRKVGCHFAEPLLFLDRVLWELLSHSFHSQANQIVHADVSKLRCLGFILFHVDDKKRNAEQDAAELVDCLAEFSGRCKQVARLKPLNEIVQLDTDCRQPLRTFKLCFISNYKRIQSPEFTVAMVAKYNIVVELNITN